MLPGIHAADIKQGCANCYGLIAGYVVNFADGFAKRESASATIADAKQVAHEEAQIISGTDKDYDGGDINGCATSQ